jgi:U3 small nucleolar RNA-associated protein 6
VIATDLANFAAVPKIDLFISLREVITEYPSPPHLRQELLAHLYDELHATLPHEPQAVKLYATRLLTPELRGEALIDGLKCANKELMHAVSASGKCIEGLMCIYAEFVEEWCSAAIDDNLVRCYGNYPNRDSLSSIYRNCIW